MPARIRTSRRTWVAAWAVLCAGGIAATAGLNASATPDPHPEKSVSAECAEQIADIDAQLATAEREAARGEGNPLLAISGIRTAGEENCDEELRDHLQGAR
ncbi:hypothetical protein AB0C93_23550 [Streptomyces sp. NPDC048518]|uniref:hypothetical protein n=1 Tax=Streptomyces sp. NPDC048518 TaxID=3155029 RepID=UPI0033E826C1